MDNSVVVWVDEWSRGGTDVEYRGSCTVLRRKKLYTGACIVQVVL